MSGDAETSMLHATVQGVVGIAGFVAAERQEAVATVRMFLRDLRAGGNAQGSSAYTSVT